MKAESLRIGNWVAINDNIYQVDVIDYNQVIEIERGIVELKYVQPIPLTEEWLLKFGYTKVKEKSGTRGIYCNGNHFLILSYGGNVYTIGRKLIGEVHTLQNVYYYHKLTGEELKLKS
jgi:hypothetical protein